MTFFIRTQPFPVIGRPPLAPWLPSKVRLRIEAINRRWRRAYLRRVLPGRDFSILACNCWGGGIYQDLGRPFQSPFIGLYLHPACFLKYVAHYEQARVAPLRFVDASRYRVTGNYPIGVLLDDIEIHFVHHPTIEEARDKWERRSRRLPENPNDAYFMLGVGSETLEEKRRFQSLPLKNKVLFATAPTPGFTEEVVVRPWRGSAMMDGTALYEHCHASFDIARWLLPGS